MKRQLTVLLILTIGITPMWAEAGRDRKRGAETELQRDQKRRKAQHITLKSLRKVLHIQAETRASGPSTLAPPALNDIVHVTLHLPEDVTIHPQILSTPTNLHLPSLTSISIYTHPALPSHIPLDLTSWTHAEWRTQIVSFNIMLPEDGQNPRNQTLLDEPTWLFLIQTFPSLIHLEVPTKLPLHAFNAGPLLQELTIHRPAAPEPQASSTDQTRPPLLLPHLQSFRANCASLFELIHLTSLRILQLNGKIPDHEVTLLPLLPALNHVEVTVSEASFHALTQTGLPWQHLSLTVDGRQPLALSLGNTFSAPNLETLELFFTPNTTHSRVATWRSFQTLLPKLQTFILNANGSPEAFDLFARDIVLGAPFLRCLEIDNTHSLNTINISPTENPTHNQLHPWYSTFYDFMRLNWPLQELARRKQTLQEEQNAQLLDFSAPLYFSRAVESLETLNQIREEMAAYTRQTEQERQYARWALEALAPQPIHPPAPQVFEINEGEVATPSSQLDPEFYPTQQAFPRTTEADSSEEEAVRQALNGTGASQL